MKRTLLLLLVSLAATMLYLVVVAVKRQLSPSWNVLGESVLLLAGLLPIVLAGLAFLYKRQILMFDGAVAVLTIFLLSGMCFTLAVPAVFDRSISLYLLNSLDNRADRGMTEDEIKTVFLDVYFDGNYALRKRLREQVQGGNLTHREGRYYITEAGSTFMSVARMISGAYALDPRIVHMVGDSKGQ